MGGHTGNKDAEYKQEVCFVVAPIGDDGSDVRKKSDKVLKHIFRAAFEPLGYRVVRADEISQPGSITLQVLEKILESELVVADLTGHNPNVFYELAVRHAAEKPVIHVIESGGKIPFDIADLRAVTIDLDLDGAERAKKELTDQVKEIKAGRTGETPVKLAGVLKHLESGKSEDKVVLRQLLEAISSLRSEVTAALDKNAYDLRRELFFLKTDALKTRSADDVIKTRSTDTESDDSSLSSELDVLKNLIREAERLVASGGEASLRRALILYEEYTRQMKQLFTQKVLPKKVSENALVISQRAEGLRALIQEKLKE